MLAGDTGCRCVAGGPVAALGEAEPALRAQAERLRAPSRAIPSSRRPTWRYTRRRAPPSSTGRVVVGADRDQLLAGLEALARGEPARAGEGVGAERRRGGVPVPRPGFAVEGHGARALDSSPVFAQPIEACARALDPFVEWSLEELLRGSRARRRWIEWTWCSRRCSR